MVLELTSAVKVIKMSVRVTEAAVTGNLFTTILVVMELNTALEAVLTIISPSIVAVSSIAVVSSTVIPVSPSG